MKRALICMATMLALTSFSMAQTTSTTTPKSKTASSDSMSGMDHGDMAGMKHGKHHGDGMKGNSITGCIGAKNDEGAYTLMKGHRKIEIGGGSDDLAPHVGHTVTLKGSWVKSGSEIGEKEDEAAEKKEKDEMKGMKGMKHERKEGHFKIESMTMVSDKCEMTSKKGAGHRANKSSAAPTT